MADDQNKSKNKRGLNRLGGSFSESVDTLTQQNISEDPSHLTVLARKKFMANQLIENSEEIAGPLFSEEMAKLSVRDTSYQIAARAKSEAHVMRSMNQIGAQATRFLNQAESGVNTGSMRGLGSIGNAGSMGSMGGGMSGMGNLNIFNDTLVASARRVEEAFKKLYDQTDKNTKQKEEEREEYFKATQEFQQKSMEGGGGGRNRLMQMAAVGSILSQGGDTWRNITVGQTNQITQTRAGAAGISNQLWDMRGAAIGGDMASLDLLSSNFMQEAQANAKINKTNTQAGQLASLGGAILSGVAGAAFGTLVGGPVGGVIGGASGFMGAATIGTNMLRGVDANAEYIAETQRQMQLQAELMKVPSAMRQQLYNYGMGQREAQLSIGGAQGERFLKQTGSVDFLNRMSTAGLGPEEMGQMSAMGGQLQGSVFNVESVFQARNLEKSGLNTKEINAQNQGLFAKAGENNPMQAYASVIESAMTKSLDNSKSINLMVSNTATMASQSAGATIAGLSTSAASSRLISEMINPNMQNKEMAINQATTAAGAFNQMSAGTSTTYADQATLAAIMTKTKVGYIGAIKLQSLDMPTAVSLQEEGKRIRAMKNPNEAKEAEAALANKLRDLSQGEFAEGSKVKFDLLDEGVKQKRYAVMRQADVVGVGFPNMRYASDIMSGKISSEDIRNNPTKYKAEFDALGLVSMKSHATAYQTIDYIQGKTTNLTPEQQAELSKNLAGLGGSELSKKEDFLKTAAGADKSKQAALAAGDLGGFEKAISKMADATSVLVKKLDETSAKDFRESAAAAAKDFNIGAGKFQSGVTEFGSILDKWSSEVGSKWWRGTPSTTRPTDTKTQKTSSGNK